MVNLFRERQLPLGLDLSDISLKLMQFRERGGKYLVQAYADAPIQKDVLAGEKIKDPGMLIKTIRQAIAAPQFGKVTTDEVVASIPETKSFVRVIQIPKMSEAEAAEAVPWEAEAYIPLPMSQVYLDWVLLAPAASALDSGGESSTEKLTVLITAAPKDYVDDLVAILKKAGLRPLALEVESQATARSLVSRPEEAVLIADINTVRTSLIIYDRGALQFTSSLPIAGNSFTESLVQGLDLDFAHAEQLKREVGIDEDSQRGAVKKSLVPVLNNLLEEIKNTIRFYEEHSRGSEKISRLLLTGGSSKLRHLPSFLHEKLTRQVAEEHPLRSLPGLKVELGNPWVNALRKGQTPALSREDSLSYTTAIGLALREQK